MSLYNLVFGQNPAADMILATLGLTRGDCGRFRDCFVADSRIAVYTRNGGGNRDDYEAVFDNLSDHPCYLYNEDDDCDPTYCTFYFRFPDEFAEDLKKLDRGEAFDPDQRWFDAIKALRASD